MSSETREVVDLAILGKLLGAVGKRLGIGHAPIHLHAGVRGLRGVLPQRSANTGKAARRGLGAGEGTAGDDAGADDVLGVRQLDLPCHVGAGGEARDRGCAKCDAQLRQRFRRSCRVQRRCEQSESAEQSERQEGAPQSEQLHRTSLAFAPRTHLLFAPPARLAAIGFLSGGAPDVL